MDRDTLVRSTVNSNQVSTCESQGLRPVTVALTRLSYRDRENRLNPADVHLSNWRPDRPAAGVRASG